MKHTLVMLTAGLSFVAAIGVAATEPAVATDQELMDKLKDAAPAAVLKGATIFNMGADGQMKAIQTGTNGWTCMDPHGAPMCADEAAMEWAKAWQAKGPAPQKLGFIYMLRGDNGTSNTDPYATEETPDNNWVTTGSHVMIVGAEAKSMMRGYPRDAKPDPTTPYVMWPGTPYEHLMLPVK
ncbi:MAG: hypothetical protein ACR2KT_17220 [Methylocella sp.]|nr:MAG: hypothetical protein DLM68_07670 [Hyphomicrobiales bacterium]